jgi:hypothetical protein
VLNTVGVAVDQNDKVDAAIEALKARGHTVRPYKHEENFWFEIDGKMLASWEEMQELANLVTSLIKLEDLFRRRKEEFDN